MDFHILIVLFCVFASSVISFLLINRFFRRKTFEEVVAEKRALTEKIYGQERAAKKKQTKKLPLKKVMKREKKQRQKKQLIKENNAALTLEDSDGNSDQQISENDSMPGLSKTHVEFEPEPEVVTYTNDTITPNIGLQKPNAKKNKKNEKKASGILLNKNEPVAIKDNSVVEETNFEIKNPKDVVELKKSETKAKEDSKHVAKKGKENKKEKLPFEKTTTTTNAIAPANITPTPQPVAVSASVVIEPKVEVIKEVKMQDEKVRNASPKTQHHQQQQQQQSNNNNNNVNKSKQQLKKQNKETAVNKELVQAISDNDTIGVSLLMNLFRRSELNRSEIQILIDYLLNRQQDMPTSHAEWSDDQCQKLKRQLDEKERALAEEQEAALGLQAKLRELRAEVNSERVQMAANMKMFNEKLHNKDQEIIGLSQEIQSLNDKLSAERQQFKAKLLHEKQSNTQDGLAQLQMMRNEMALKDKCINEMTCLVNASRQSVEEAQQKNEIIAQQSQQIRALEQQCDELEQITNNQIFELEKFKTLETENVELKLKFFNLQNALESCKADLAQGRQDIATMEGKLLNLRNYELNDIKNLEYKNAELTKQLAGVSSKTLEQSKEHDDLQGAINSLQSQVTEKEHQLGEFKTQQNDLEQRVQLMAQNAQQQTAQQLELQQQCETLQAEVNNKQQQLQEMEQRSQQLNSREKELLTQLQEHKEKNNDLRMKNWKLIEALQTAETKVSANKVLTTEPKQNIVQQQQLLSAMQNPALATTNTSVDSAAKEQAKIRALYERLYPEAVKACASIALSASFDKWVEQVLSTHIKEIVNTSPATSTATTNTVALRSINKSTQSNNNTNNNNGTSNGAEHNNNNNNSHNDENLSNSNSSSNNNNSDNNRINNDNNDNNTPASSEIKNDDEMQKLQVHNAQLCAKIDELTKLVTKTSNTLSDLEGRAREQEDHWRSVVRSQEEKILYLQHSNGEQDV